MGHLTTEQVIAAPPHEVYELIGDPAALAEALQPGGQRASSTADIVEATPDERVVSRSSGRINARGLSWITATIDRVRTLAPHPDGTLLRTEIRWRFGPPLRGPLLYLLVRKRFRESIDMGLRALQVHFEAPVNELTVTYDWTRSDRWALRRSALYRNRRLRLAVVLFPLSVLLAALVWPGLWAAVLIVGLNVIGLAAQILVAWRPPPAESSVVFDAGPGGVRLATSRNGAGIDVALAWAELTTIRHLPHYLIFSSGKPAVPSQIVPKRAFDQIPNGLEKLRQMGMRAGSRAA